MARLARILSLGAAAIALSGCVTLFEVGPDYKRPENLPAQAAYRDAPIMPPPSADSIANMAWWEVFDDPVLQGLIKTAVGTNYDVRIAVTRIEQARAQLGVAEAGFYPQIGYDALASRGQRTALGNPAPSVTRSTNYFMLSGSASWEIDLWGRIRRSTESARAQLLATEEARRGVLLSLVGSVASTYYTLLELDLELEIAKDTVKTYTDTVALFERRLLGGVASELETISAKANLAQVQAKIPTIEQQITQTENGLSVLLGRPPGGIPRGKPLMQQTWPAIVPAGLPADLIERRPDLRQAEQTMRSANAQVGVAQANYYPTISLTGLLGALSPQMSNLLNGNGNMWSGAAGLTGPIFTGGQLDAQLANAKAQWEEARLSYEQSILTAFKEVANALVAREKVELARVEQARAVVALQRAVKLATERYVGGLANYYEVLQWEEQLFPAQTTLAGLEGQRYTALVQLYQALGGGWNLKDQQWTGLDSIERQ
jgi:multidrug efflux system outer membrane protein